MDIRQLSYFVAVYEQGSVSAAARQCCVAQPSLSAALRQLEQELGVTLFIRLPKGVTPTEDGEKLYGHAGRLLSQLQSLKASFTEPVARVKFRLGLIRALGVERMSQLLREFSNSLPGLELHLVEPDEPCDARIINIRQLKAGEMARFHARYAEMRQHWAGYRGYDAWVARANNASFGAQAAYDDLVPGFEALFEPASGY